MRPGILPLERLAELMALAPRKRFGIPMREDDRCEWELDTAYEIDPETFQSKGRATPFAGRKVYGRCVKTVHNNRTVFEAKQ